jgi:formamidopyrimidine-DNA glycosylase
MPELPEVETITHSLNREGLIGQAVVATALFWPRSLARPTPSELAALLPGQVLHSIARRGKFILLHFESDTLLIHLRMSGDLRVVPLPAQDELPLTHDRFWLDFSGAQRLVFNDPRKFGRLWLVSDPLEVTGSLGAEPFDPALTPETFHALLVSRRRQLKPLLLDQTFIAGLGNIYTDEALHLARLHPLALASELTPAQSSALLLAVRSVLDEGIRRNGASIDWVYRGGDFQNHFRAYQRTGLPCPVCGTPIQRITLGQRGTHFCPTCQPLKS